MPAGALVRERVDALLPDAGLESAGESGPMPPVLSTRRCDDGCIVRLGGSRGPRWRWGGRVGVACRDADRDRTGAPTAWLALGVELGLRVGSTLRLLQASGFAQRCADVAGPLLADSPSRVGKRLLLLRCEHRFVGSHLGGPVRLVVLGCSRNRVLNHGASEYRRVRTRTHATRPGMSDTSIGQSSKRSLSVNVRHFVWYSWPSMMPSTWSASNALRSWLISRRRTSATDRTSGV